MRQFDRKLILEDGSQWPGYGFGGDGHRVCELVFNTSMAGYQEIISDPSYAGQIIVMTYPLIGNYGITDEDYESRLLALGGLVVRDYNDMPSNFRYTKTLSETLAEGKIPGISGVDTRALAKRIRDGGNQKAVITDINTPLEEALALVRETPLSTRQVASVSCKKQWYARTSNHRFNVAAVDCGMKSGIVKELNRHGCNVTIVPYSITAEEIDFMKPDGVFLSNGPGDPENVPEVIEQVRRLRGKYPIFGICLGHQILSLAYGAKTYKLKFGHRGGNHPVKNLLTDKIEITSQNHGYAVDRDSLAGTGLELTHVNLLDNTVEGVRCVEDRAFSVQYHPESRPGPQDSRYLFDTFINLMEEAAHAKEN